MKFARTIGAAVAAIALVGAASAGQAVAGGHGYQGRQVTYVAAPVRHYHPQIVRTHTPTYVRVVQPVIVAAPVATYHHAHYARPQPAYVHSRTVRVPVLTCQCVQVGCRQYMTVHTRY